jgi:transposase-like protein
MERLQRDPVSLPDPRKEKPRDNAPYVDNELRFAKTDEILKDLESINDMPMNECPLCFRSLQKYGKKVGSNSVLFQRFVCPNCRSMGRKYNYFLDIRAALE